MNCKFVIHCVCFLRTQQLTYSQSCCLLRLFIFFQFAQIGPQGELDCHAWVQVAADAIEFPNVFLADIEFDGESEDRIVLFSFVLHIGFLFFGEEFVVEGVIGSDLCFLRSLGVP